MWAAGHDPGGIPALSNLPQNLSELRRHPQFSEERVLSRRVKDELRDNLIARLRTDGPIFPGIVGFDDTVVPQVVNAILSRHNFILLGLRGQAKSRILRALTALLDPQVPYIAGCEIHDNPVRSAVPSLQADGRGRSRGSRDRVSLSRRNATSRSWPRPTSPSPT